MSWIKWNFIFLLLNEEGVKERREERGRGRKKKNSGSAAVALPTWLLTLASVSPSNSDVRNLAEKSSRKNSNIQEEGHIEYVQYQQYCRNS
jgi:hypothetical protein